MSDTITTGTYHGFQAGDRFKITPRPSERRAIEAFNEALEAPPHEFRKAVNRAVHEYRASKGVFYVHRVSSNSFTIGLSPPMIRRGFLAWLKTLFGRT